MPLSGCQWAAQRFFLPSEGVRSAEYGVEIQRHAALSTSDNIELVADVYRPSGLEKTPTILVRIPYSKTLANQIRAEAVGRFWASRGYTAVIQGTRGRYESGGCYYPLLDERQDGIETFRWLSMQPWYDGKIGMWGGSAFGYTQWVLADQTDPGPAALDIQISSSDFHGMFYPGGAFSLESALYWAVQSHGKEDETPSQSDLERGYDGFPLVEADDRAVGDVTFFNDWVRHREKDEYWKQIDGIDRPKQIKAPVLLMAGWYDPFLPTQLNDFMRIRSEAEANVASTSRLVIGPWTHADTVTFPDGADAGSYRQDVLAPSIEWFDRHLMAGTSMNKDEAPVRIYVMGDNVWRDEQEWPLSRARPKALFLGSDGNANTRHGTGELVANAPVAQGVDRYSYDPRNPAPSRGGAMLGPRAGIALQGEIEEREDVLVYTSDVLPQDMEVTGNVEVDLYVGTSAANTDFFAKLVDVHADGRAYNVSDGIVRRDFVATGIEPHQITIHLWPTSMVFKKGHRIRLEVSSSSFPRYDRNPNTGRDIATETKPIVARQTIFHGAATPSRLVLPIVERP